jgi:phospholipid/cholesterol/gamma-HCH transport system substrate-binding protein
MTGKSQYFKLGVFVIAAIAIALIGVVILGAGSLFRKEIPVETYFNQSVQGLAVGSPIKFRGIEIGKVTRITIALAEYHTDKHYVLVRSSLYEEMFMRRTEAEIGKEINKQVKNGLRTRLAYQGLTGAAFLEVDYLDPEQYQPLPIDWPPKHIYIPSAPSVITQLSESLTRIMRSLEGFNVQGLATRLELTLDTMIAVMEGADLSDVTDEAQLLLAELRDTNKKVNKLAAALGNESTLNGLTDTVNAAGRLIKNTEKPLADTLVSLNRAAASLNRLSNRLESSPDGLPQTLAQLRVTLKRLDRLVSAPQRDLEEALADLRAASGDLRELTENARRNPSQILFGRPPAPTEYGERP